MSLPSGGVSRFLQFISMLNRVNRQLLPGREALCVRPDDGRFIRAHCAILGAIGNNDDTFNPAKTCTDWRRNSAAPFTHAVFPERSQ
jgi:hypothetical protein